MELELRQSRDGSTARDVIDTAVLSPRARALAEAVAARPTQSKGVIRMLTGLTADDGAPEVESWSGWGFYPVDSPMEPHAYLEQQAAKIPLDWTVLGLSGVVPVVDQDAEWTVRQCADFHGVQPGTWRSYVARRAQTGAPAPVGQRDLRTPVWLSAAVRGWRRPGAGARTDRVKVEPAETG